MAIIAFAGMGDALAITTGTNCAAATDINGGDIGSRSYAAGQFVQTPPNCTSFDILIVSSGILAGPGLPIAVEINTNNVSDGSMTVNTLRIDWDTGVLSNVRIGGVLRSGGQWSEPGLTTAAAYSTTVSYQYSGSYYQFTIAKAGGTNILSAFTIADFTPPTPEIDVQRPASTSIADGGTDAQGAKTAGCSRYH
ncbi:MAG: hypothetical protein ABW072_15735 [Sedimenticola sp.]